MRTKYTYFTTMRSVLSYFIQIIGRIIKYSIQFQY